MKILMDADCLIKITKCGLKHFLCQHFKIFIPSKVQEEVVEKGIQKGCADAFIVKDNIKKGLLIVKKHQTAYHHGEQEIIALFQPDRYDAIATDDAKFIRLLTMANIPYILPAVFIAILHNKKILSLTLALQKLQELSAYISNDEYMTTRLFLEKKK